MPTGHLGPGATLAVSVAPPGGAAAQMDTPMVGRAPMLPEGTGERLLQPGNKKVLVGVLTAHVVSGNALSAQVTGRSLYLHDRSGNAARITIGDVDRSNGVTRVVVTLLPPG